MNSYKTTGAAIAALLTAIALAVSAYIDGDAATTPNWTGVITCLIASVGFFFARDNSKSSEDVGAKK